LACFVEFRQARDRRLRSAGCFWASSGGDGFLPDRERRAAGSIAQIINMDTAWISAFSAVMGSLVGAFTSFVTTYANQRAQYRRDFLSRQFAQRENLYSEFINEAARLVTDSLEQEMIKPSALVRIYGLENRIRLNASDEVVQAARSAIQEIVESYRRPPMTEEEIRRGAYLEIKDPVKGFGEACRKELNRLYRATA
jgi:hypothetical protein